MDDKNNQNPLLAISIITVLFAALGVTIFPQGSLKGIRPPVPEIHEPSQQVRARLWEDPFQAVMTQAKAKGGGQLKPAGEIFLDKPEKPTRRSLAKKTNKKKNQDSESLVDKINEGLRNNKTVTILGVMVSGRPYEEDTEHRLRRRYAVLSAMGKLGFTSVTDDRIGFLRVFQNKPDEEKKPPNAALSALGRLGFTPEKSEYILSLRVFQEKPTKEPEPTISLSTLMPFEWLVSYDRQETVLLLWINEDAFGSKPLSKLDCLIASLQPEDKELKNNLSFKLIGPAESTTLLDMLRELTPRPEVKQAGGVGAGTGFPHLRGLQIFSPSATASAKALLQEVQADNTGFPYKSGFLSPLKSSAWSQHPENLKFFVALRMTMFNNEEFYESINRVQRGIEELFKGKDIEFNRIICSDEDLCETLLEELRHRGVGPQDNIVLVAEWDTFYGRKLPETFEEVRKTKDGPESKRRMLRFSYLRGIDGKLPGESDRSADKERKNGGEQKEREDLQKGEEPEGKNQYDYLRRLAEAICSHEKDLKQNGKGEIKAIGVLGSDFHDKYLVLQALGQRFPDKIFFTTDLDARLLHPANLQWTRNLLVASGFGLQLREDLQGEIPPFREGYQAAVFLATLRALNPDDLIRVLEERQPKENNLWPPEPRISEIYPVYLTRPRDHNPWPRGPRIFEIYAVYLTRPRDYNPWPPEPRIFEIGRRHAIDLTSPKAGGYVPVNQALPPANFPRLKKILPIWGYVVCLIILVTSLSICCAWVKTDLLDLWHICWQFIKKKPELFGTGGLVILALLILFFDPELRKPTEEPFFLTEGISVWPTEIMRLVAVILSVIFCVIAWYRLQINQGDLEKEFCLKTNQKEDRPKIDFHRGEDRKNRNPGPQPCHQTQYLNMDRAWEDYVARGKWCWRFWRFFPLMLIYSIFTGMIIVSFGKPFRPVRGEATGILDFLILGIAIGAFLFLAFFIFDAFMLCRGFITRWLDKEAAWSKISKRAFKKGRVDKVEGQVLSDWMLVRLIAERTKMVGKLIFFPFIVWFILFLARQPYFDKYPTPIGLFIVITMGALLPWVCALILRRSAEKLRAVVVDRVSQKLILGHWHTDKGEEPMEHLKYMLAEIKSARTGAFSSYLKSPVWRSLLVPFGGVSIVTLLDYISKLP
jgi:hypothetical protein